MGTYAQQLIEQGIKQGMQKGEHTILLRLFKCKFQTLSNDLLQRIEAADEDTLLLWADRLIDAKTIEEVMGN